MAHAHMAPHLKRQVCSARLRVSGRSDLARALANWLRKTLPSTTHFGCQNHQAWLGCGDRDRHLCGLLCCEELESHEDRLASPSLCASNARPPTPRSASAARNLVLAPWSSGFTTVCGRKTHKSGLYVANNENRVKSAPEPPQAKMTETKL